MSKITEIIQFSAELESLFETLDRPTELILLSKILEEKAHKIRDSISAEDLIEDMENEPVPKQKKVRKYKPENQTYLRQKGGVKWARLRSIQKAKKLGLKTFTWNELSDDEKSQMKLIFQKYNDERTSVVE